MMRFGLFGGAAMLIFAATAPAQTTLLPRQCAGMTGDQLDLCVRNITLPQMVPTIEDVAVKPDPAQPMDCATVTRADEDYCIARNQIVIECRKRNKYPDFEQCANPLAAAQAKPPVANCSRVAEPRRKECELRNKVFGECTGDPLRYFICLAEKINAQK